MVGVGWSGGHRSRIYRLSRFIILPFSPKCIYLTIFSTMPRGTIIPYRSSSKTMSDDQSISSSSSASSGFFTLPFRRRRQRYIINPPDDVYNVVYLGNVLTILAKGENCVDRPLHLIWKTYCTQTRPELHMKFSVTRQGLKAETKQQGLTEYWAHRITFCLAPTQYPRVFCWIYKHEGKRMKPELRCHAVLCRKPIEPSTIAVRLSDFLHAALAEYRRDKIAKQNSRLYSNVTGNSANGPRRKVLLQTGALNFRPPVSRSKSAPRLGSIDEEQEETNDETRPGAGGEHDKVHRLPSPAMILIDEDEDVDLLCYHQPSSSACGSSTCSTEDGSSMASSSSNGTEQSPPTYLRSSIIATNALIEIDRLKIDRLPTTITNAGSVLMTSTKTFDPDSVSDESGYHEDKTSLGTVDSDNDQEDEDYDQITAL